MPRVDTRSLVELRAARTGQRGVALVIALIALLVLMIGGVALIRSMDTSMLLAGNLAFKRDLVNQGERGVAQAFALLRTGALSGATTREANRLANNYSASVLASDVRGMPLVLADNAAFAAAAMAGADINAGGGVTIRYVIDRQCAAAGAFDVAQCMVSTTKGDKGGSEYVKKAGGESKPVYRISVRVSGPRGTQTYMQSTVAL